MMIARMLLWIYIRLVRPWSSPLFRFFALWGVKPKVEAWLELRDLPETEFSRKLGEIGYVADPVGGLIDYTITDPEYFWSEANISRDCDDFAYQWFLWGKHNCDEAMTIVIMDGMNIRKSHYFTVLRQGKAYRLCNYAIDAATYESIEECAKQFSLRSLVLSGTYKTPIWIIDEHWKKEK